MAVPEKADAPPAPSGRGLVVPWFSLALGLLLLAVYVGFDGLAMPLIYDREAIRAGELWRLFTAHLTHASPAHLVWNVGAFMVMGTLLEMLYKLSFSAHATLLGVAGMGVTAWVWFFQPELLYFAGISAVLNAQFIVLVVFVWRETRHPLALLVGLGGLLKIVAELYLGTPVLSSVEGRVIPEAHAVGFAMGVVWLAFVGKMKPSAWNQKDINGIRANKQGEAVT